MSLKPWYKVVTPREDLREGKPLDASEFAVHLDQVREGLAPADYQKPERFFERTYLTKNLASLASEVIRRLSGEKTETNAIFIHFEHNIQQAFGCILFLQQTTEASLSGRDPLPKKCSRKTWQIRNTRR